MESGAGDAKKWGGGESALGLAVAAASGFQSARAGPGVWGVPASAGSGRRRPASALAPVGTSEWFCRGIFFAAEPPFVLVCVLRLPENSVGYPKLPSITFFLFQ